MELVPICIEDDDDAANDLREFIRRFFFVESNVQTTDFVPSEEIESETQETNFLQIPTYQSSITGRERKDPLPEEDLKIINDSSKKNSFWK